MFSPDLRTFFKKEKLSFSSITESNSSKDKSEILALQAKVKELEDTHNYFIMLGCGVAPQGDSVTPLIGINVMILHYIKPSHIYLNH